MPGETDVTDQFFIGIGIGFAIALVLWIATMRTYDRYLMRASKAQNRTPVCIRGQFFYVVPASEYVHEHLQLRRVADSFNRSEIRHD